VLNSVFYFFGRRRTNEQCACWLLAQLWWSAINCLLVFLWAGKKWDTIGNKQRKKKHTMDHVCVGWWMDHPYGFFFIFILFSVLKYRFWRRAEPLWRPGSWLSPFLSNLLPPFSLFHQTMMMTCRLMNDDRLVKHYRVTSSSVWLLELGTWPTENVQRKEITKK
jgi:hypothetical protein